MEATKLEEKTLFAEVLAIIVKILMNNHVYTLGRDLRIQEGNGSIGDRATGSIAQIVMMWDKKFKMKLDELGIVYDLIKRFIDDVNGVFGIIAPGTEYKNGKLMINNEKVERDKNVDEDY